MKQAPIRVRLTLWYVGLLAIILAAFGAGVYLTLQGSLYHNLDDAIEAQANTFLGTVQFDDGRPRLPGGLTEATDGDDGFVQIVDPAQPAGTSDPEIRVRSFPIVRDGQTVGVLEVGQSREFVTEALDALLLTMAVAYPLTLVVAVLGGVFLARRALSPVDKITDLARRVSAEDLGQRLDLQLPDDEVGRLAATFDEMIGRLDEAFRRQRQFTADASHELRTPLTVMKGQVEVALQKERAPADYRDVLREVNGEVDRLIGLAGSLLTLARADAGEIPLDLERVDVGELLSGTVEHMRPAAAAKEIGIEVVPGTEAMVRIDEDLVLQLLLNLLDNAIKYTPNGGRIAVGWTTSGDKAELWVRDTGVGIPQEHLPHVMERFYRVDDARSRSDGGVGLGLAISRWIAEAHGASLRAESVPGQGSTFAITLPVAVR